jgi:hypothetical protein
MAGLRTNSSPADSEIESEYVGQHDVPMHQAFMVNLNALSNLKIGNGASVSVDICEPGQPAVLSRSFQKARSFSAHSSKLGVKAS